MEFYKIVGSGNDFVIVDNRGNRIIKKKLLAGKICQSKYGIGADGLILLEKSRKADFKMRIFNPDGSEAEMCGNGLRCLVRFIQEKNLSKNKHLNIETRAGIYETIIKGRYIAAKMFFLSKPKLNLSIDVNNENINVHYVNTGVPHTVLFTEDVENLPIETMGHAIRYHKTFQPAGTNVDWVKIMNPREIKVRTYERGVEGETLACGTGVTASVICACLLKKIKSPVNVIVRSGETLKASFSDDLKNIFLEGDAKIVFHGDFRLK
ncbi:MAG: diaminopimelate epimerase [Candidatus Omnitrophica bacterium]|nr:diaminopimelate epimerase [Candidatus Omnitrophota bacterium]